MARVALLLFTYYEEKAVKILEDIAHGYNDRDRRKYKRRLWRLPLGDNLNIYKFYLITVCIFFFAYSHN